MLVLYDPLVYYIRNFICRWQFFVARLQIMTVRIELFFAAGFGGFEVFKNYYHAHPIWKSIQVATGRNCYDLVSSFSQVPRRQRSKRRVCREKKTAVQDVGMLCNSPSILFYFLT